MIFMSCNVYLLMSSSMLYIGQARCTSSCACGLSHCSWRRVLSGGSWCVQSHLCWWPDLWDSGSPHQCEVWLLCCWRFTLGQMSCGSSDSWSLQCHCQLAGNTRYKLEPQSAVDSWTEWQFGHAWSVSRYVCMYVSGLTATHREIEEQSV